jgi:hypothetical protein
MSSVEALLLDGQYQAALDLLDSMNPQSSVEKRIMLHQRAQISIYLGDLENAKTALLTAERYCGENIAVLRDLACVYYQTGEIHQWRNSLAELSERMERLGLMLKPATWIQTMVTIAKFREEDGAIAEAAQNYQAAYDKACEHELSDLRHLALIQLLRIESLYSRGPQLGQLYRQLLVLAAPSLSFDLLVEREHTLMLAEIDLVGPRSAWTRVSRLLQNPKTSNPDRRLLIADFLAESLIRGHTPSDEARELATRLLLDGDAFEREVALSIEHGQNPLTHLERLQLAASEMSWACYLRLITLHHEINADTKCREELANKLSVLLSTLTPTSRFFWMKRVQTKVFSDQMSLQFHPQQRWVKFQGKTLDLSKKRTLCAVLNLVCTEKQVDVDTLIKKLWQADFSPEHLHRLRMAVHRLNHLLFELSAVPRVIEMSADQVAVKASIEIQAVG